MRAADHAFLTSERGPAELAALTTRAAERARRPARRLLRAAPALALAASVLVAFLWLRPAELGAPTERMKGATHVELWVDRGGHLLRFEAQPLGAGDTLAFRYTTTRRWLLVLDAEASGKMSAVVAREDGTSVPIEPGQDRTAPLGVRLDDYPGAERFIAVFSDAPLDAEPLLEALRARLEALPAGAREGLELGALELSGDQSSWLVKKEVR